MDVVLLHTPRKWVVPLCWGMVLTSLCMLSRLCYVSNVCGLLVGFQWSVNFSLRMVILEEQDCIVLGVFWPLPSGLVSENLK